jgi:glycerol-3-phosphate acyltransferase PlsY
LIDFNFICFFVGQLNKIDLMNTILIISLFTGAYLLGSIPSAVWFGRMLCGVDVREHGSKNAGATNTIRVLGWKAGLPVLILDVLKGYAAVNLVWITSYNSATSAFVNVQLLLGGFAVVGHIFPVFAQFRGGKGVATLFGIVLAIAPLPTFLTLCVFLVTLFITKYVSLSSMAAGLSFPVFVMFVCHSTIQSLIIFSLVVSILLLLTHQKNIERLLKRQESKANFLFKKK